MFCSNFRNRVSLCSSLRAAWMRGCVHDPLTVFCVCVYLSWCSVPVSVVWHVFCTFLKSLYRKLSKKTVYACALISGVLCFCAASFSCVHACVKCSFSKCYSLGKHWDALFLSNANPPFCLSSLFSLQRGTSPQQSQLLYTNTYSASLPVMLCCLSFPL